MAAARPAILLHLELAVQSTKGQRALHTTPLHTAFGSVQWILTHPISFTVIRPWYTSRNIIEPTLPTYFHQ